MNHILEEGHTHTHTPEQIFYIFKYIENVDAEFRKTEVIDIFFTKAKAVFFSVYRIFCVCILFASHIDISRIAQPFVID